MASSIVVLLHFIPLVSSRRLYGACFMNPLLAAPRPYSSRLRNKAPTHTRGFTRGTEPSSLPHKGAARALNDWWNCSNLRNRRLHLRAEGGNQLLFFRFDLRMSQDGQNDEAQPRKKQMANTPSTYPMSTAVGIGGSARLFMESGISESWPVV